jgi:hypothetical protein
MKLFVMQFLHPPVTSSLFGPTVCFSILFSVYNSTFNVREIVSHPYRTTGKVIVLQILSFTFIDSRPENRRFWTQR